MLGLGGGEAARRGGARYVVGLAADPDHGAVGELQEPRRPRPDRRRHGVGEDDDRGFQPLGAVHGHDADFVARDLHVAFDLGAGVAQPGDETLQRRRLAPLVVQRQIEKLVERIVGLGAEPAEETASRAAGAEKPGIECKRRVRPRVVRELIEPRRGARKNPPLRRLFRQRDAQRRAAAVVGDGEQIVVGKAEQRTAQRGGERKVVLRQRERVGERDQIHHRDMLGQHQAVGAGHFDALLLQRADDRLEQFAALAHQDQNVAIARGAVVDHPAHGAGDAPGEPHPRARLAHGIERRVPALDLLALIGLRRLPDLDHARRRVR